MATIQVTARSENEYRVRVEDGRGSSEHRVTVSPEELERYGAGADPEDLVEESFRFLLDREPKESILSSFGISTIERYFSDYPEAIRQRLG